MKNTGSPTAEALNPPRPSAGGSHVAEGIKAGKYRMENRPYPESKLPSAVCRLGGRPLGSRNRAGYAAERLAELGFDPIGEAVARYRDPLTPNRSKDFCLGVIIDRLLPKLRAIEITGGDQTARNILINIVSGTPCGTSPDPTIVPLNE